MSRRRSAPSRIDWYPEDWLHGTAGLNAEQLAVYVQVVNLIYAHRGRLPDNDDRNHRSFLISLRRFRAVKAELVAMGKIQIVDGMIYQRRAVEEWQAAVERYDNFSERGAKAAKKRWDIDEPAQPPRRENGGSSGDSSGGSSEDKALKIVGGTTAIQNANALENNETPDASGIPTSTALGNTHPPSDILQGDSYVNEESDSLPTNLESSTPREPQDSAIALEVGGIVADPQSTQDFIQKALIFGANPAFTIRKVRSWTSLYGRDRTEGALVDALMVARRNPIGFAEEVLSRRDNKRFAAVETAKHRELHGKPDPVMEADRMTREILARMGPSNDDDTTSYPGLTH